MTAELGGPVTRDRRFANLRASLARSGGGPAGEDPLPARAPFSGRRSGRLAARLAGALGADAADTPEGWLVRRVVPPLDIPVDRERLARLPGHRQAGVPRRARALGGVELPADPAAAPGPRRRARAARRDRALGHPGRVARQLQRARVRLAADRSALSACRPGRAGPRGPP